MKTTKRKIPTNSISLRAIQAVSLALALIACASWLAPTGHTSSGPARPVANAKVSPPSRSAHVNAWGGRLTSSPTSQLTANGVKIWTTNGPEGGSITSLVIDATNPEVIYASTYDSGVFKTVNSGASWSSANNGQPDLYVRTLAIDPGNTSTVYAASYSGVFKSTNGGSSWSSSSAGLPNGDEAVALVIDPNNSNIIYAGFSSSGVFKSTNGGASWSPSSQGLSTVPYTPVLALVFDPNDPNTLYAGMSSNGTLNGGFFKSTDGGSKWSAVGTDHSTFNALAIAPGASSTLYASTFHGLIKSTDGGASWIQSNTGLPISVYPPVALVIDPSHPDTIFAGFSSGADLSAGGRGVFKSIDGGSNWSPVNDGLTGGVTTLAIDPHNPTTIYAGADGSGIFKSENGSTKWSAVNSGVNGIHVTYVAADPVDADIVYSGTDHGVFKSSNGGASWGAVNTSQAVSALSIAPTKPQIIYAGIDYGGCCGGVLKSTDSGATWSFKQLGDYGVTALATDPSDPDTVYASAYLCYFDYGCDASLFKSTDGGASWNAVVYASGPLAIDSSNPKTIYVGSWGLIGKSTDGGANWNFFNQGLPGTFVNALAIDPGEPNTIYAGTGYLGYPPDPNTAVFKSTDGGLTWESVLPTNSVVTALAIDSSNANTIYAGTLGAGVFKSTDAGASWSEFNEGLTNLNINALALDASGRFLHAATPAGVFDYQYAPSCAYSISALGQSFSTDSAIGSVSVTTRGGCNWQASSSVSWITINSGSNGSGNGNVSFSVAANTEVNPRTATLTIAGQTFIVNQSGPQPLNPIDDAQFLVRRHYLDFLNREPDQNGFAFWTREILSCGGDANCTVKRINVSAAYFLSIEFQQTGYLVYRFYKASYGNLPGAPVPIKLSEFLPDTKEIGQGVIVNQAGWEQALENNKQAFASEFVQRTRFTAAFPTSMTPDAFVDALFANAGVVPAASDRTAAINEFGSAITSADVAARARALRRVAENSTLARQEFNRAFVLMQYFGYLRRNPNDPPEPTLDFSGYNFWLTKLDSFNGNFQNAEMVKAFLVSSEYRQRFVP